MLRLSALHGCDVLSNQNGPPKVILDGNFIHCCVSSNVDIQQRIASVLQVLLARRDGHVSTHLDNNTLARQDLVLYHTELSVVVALLCTSGVGSSS